MEIAELIGKTLTGVKQCADEITFVTEDKQYKLYHDQSCCESVSIVDVCGSFDDLVGSPVLMAEEANNTEEKEKEKIKSEYGGDSNTWTFYKLATVKGYVTIQWHGSSNGYYSESVDFEEVK